MGIFVGVSEGVAVEGFAVGLVEGLRVGVVVGSFVGAAVGCRVGSYKAEMTAYPCCEFSLFVYVKPATDE